MAALGLTPGPAFAQEVCEGSGRLLVVLDEPLSIEAQPWADVGSLEDDAPLARVTIGGPPGTVWARPVPETSLEVLAGWLLQQPGVGEVRCGDSDTTDEVELTPFPQVIERPDPVEPTPGRPGGLPVPGRPGPQPAPDPGDSAPDSPDPAPDPDPEVEVEGAGQEGAGEAPGDEVLVATGPRDGLLVTGLGMVGLGAGLVARPGRPRRSAGSGRPDSARNGQPRNSGMTIASHTRLTMVALKAVWTEAEASTPPTWDRTMLTTSSSSTVVLAASATGPPLVA